MFEGEIQIPEGLTTSGVVGRRYLARLIDGVIALLLFFVLVVVLGIVRMVATGEADLSEIQAVFLAASTYLAYGTLMESSRWQATVGKKILKVRVYNIAGGRMSFSTALARNAIREIPFAVLGALPGGQFTPFVLLVIHALVLHQSDLDQAIHDRIVGSLVAAREETTQLRLNA